MYVRNAARNRSNSKFILQRVDPCTLVPPWHTLGSHGFQSRIDWVGYRCALLPKEICSCLAPAHQLELIESFCMHLAFSSNDIPWKIYSAVLCDLAHNFLFTFMLHLSLAQLGSQPHIQHFWEALKRSYRNKTSCKHAHFKHFIILGTLSLDISSMDHLFAKFVWVPLFSCQLPEMKGS